MSKSFDVTFNGPLCFEYGYGPKGEEITVKKIKGNEVTVTVTCSHWMWLQYVIHLKWWSLSSRLKFFFTRRYFKKAIEKAFMRSD